MTREDTIINAGRLINDISMSELTKGYERKILDFVSLLQFKTVVFDFDGTLTWFKYAEDRLLPCKDSDLYEYSKKGNIYENVNILRTMQYVMNELNPNDVFILTTTVETLRSKKVNVILRSFPTVKKDNIIHTYSSNEKIDKLREIYEL